MISSVKVKIWGRDVGVVTIAGNRVPSFEYFPEFVSSGCDLSPLHMPLQAGRVYSFPQHITNTGYPSTFHGLPGMLADALPEKFGNRLLAAMLAKQGRTLDEMSVLERLSYLGSRGMGALEFEPALDTGHDAVLALDVQELLEVARDVLSEQQSRKLSNKEASLEKLIAVGTSAGGAKAKAVIAINDQGDIVSGQAAAPPGYRHWLLKFDDVDNEELATSKELGRMEYAYHLMAVEAGIEMTECRLLEKGGLAHFMTRRFDRLDDGEKLHIQSFCALAHADRNPPGLQTYEGLFLTARRLACSYEEHQQLYRRMVFNILARNQDDHTKNFAFAMGKNGEWFLAPAFDLCFSYKPGNPFIEQHQISCNGKRDDFTLGDLLAAAKAGDIKQPKKIIAEVEAAVNDWAVFSEEAGLSEERTLAIGGLLRSV